MSRHDASTAPYNSAGPRLFNDSVTFQQAEARAAQLRAVVHVAAVPRHQKGRRALLMAWYVSFVPSKEENLTNSILTGFFFSLLDMTIVSTSLLATSEDLNGFSDSSWVVLAYLLTYMGALSSCERPKTAADRLSFAWHQQDFPCFLPSSATSTAGATSWSRRGSSLS